jgi:hypothetical protein
VQPASHLHLPDTCTPATTHHLTLAPPHPKPPLQGNVIDPRVVIEGGKDAKKDPAYGADVLRLWVASVDYSNDVMVGGATATFVCVCVCVCVCVWRGGECGVLVGVVVGEWG